VTEKGPKNKKPAANTPASFRGKKPLFRSHLSCGKGLTRPQKCRLLEN